MIKNTLELLHFKMKAYIERIFVLCFVFNRFYITIKTRLRVINIPAIVCLVVLLSKRFIQFNLTGEIMNSVGYLRQPKLQACVFNYFFVWVRNRLIKRIANAEYVKGFVLYTVSWSTNLQKSIRKESIIAYFPSVRLVN